MLISYKKQYTLGAGQNDVNHKKGLRRFSINWIEIVRGHDHDFSLLKTGCTKIIVRNIMPRSKKQQQSRQIKA